ncbi:DUF645 family protein, partial [Vibrio cholerae]
QLLALDVCLPDAFA